MEFPKSRCFGQGPSLAMRDSLTGAASVLPASIRNALEWCGFDSIEDLAEAYSQHPEETRRWFVILPNLGSKSWEKLVPVLSHYMSGDMAGRHIRLSREVTAQLAFLGGDIPNMTKGTDADLLFQCQCLFRDLLTAKSVEFNSDRPNW